MIDDTGDLVGKTFAKTAFTSIYSYRMDSLFDILIRIKENSFGKCINQQNH